MLLHFLDIAGVSVFAISGALAAGRKSLDLVGVIVIATVTATGGGTLRDLLMNRQPFWVSDPSYLTIIIASAVVTIVYVRFRRPPNKSLQIADALGLGFFTISGARIAEQSQLAPLIIVVMATVTGIFGGVLRDVLCAEIPMVFRKDTLYATAAIAGASIYVVIPRAFAAPEWAAALGMLVVVGVRLAAMYWRITLPVFSVSKDDEST